MYRITGKQRFGAVWHDGECIAVFEKGVAVTDDTQQADILRKLGYTVEGKADSVEGPVQEDAANTKSADTEAITAVVSEEAPEMMGANTKRTRAKKGE